MDSVGLGALKTSIRWLGQGRRMLPITVVRTWSSPSRSEGVMLALRDNDVITSSTSGNCIEDDLIDRVRREGLHHTRLEAVKYGINVEGARRFGLPYGGTLQLVLEPLNAPNEIDVLLRTMEAGQLVTRTLDMTIGAMTPQRATATDGPQLDEARFVTIHGPRYRMLIIGAGQLSHYLCQIAVGLDCQAIICDPREERSEEWLIPDMAIVHTMPDDMVMAMKLSEHCVIIALAHDPKLSDLTLMETLRTPVFYVGTLDSRRSNASHRERLRKSDLSGAELMRLYRPIDIYIGSHTPPEITTLILTRVTTAKNDVSLPVTLQVEGAKATRKIVANAASSCAMSQN